MILLMSIAYTKYVRTIYIVLRSIVYEIRRVKIMIVSENPAGLISLLTLPPPTLKIKLIESLCICYNSLCGTPY